MVLSRILNQCKRFLQRTDGASGIEYAIVAAMVAVVIIGVSGDVSAGIQGIFDKIVAAMPA
ncbi:Flp family type IVb pilin [Pseudomonas sp. MAFF212428]|uniref:Flp family type IVb pilin n=1 Tax=Pseudomonas brassicae TaxID=2708063 RepID=A0A6B3P0R9_9PSED|nr:Flp family type IVb pilin [Pseudomonas brassicae]NER62365.1 Flp family type IVb pilin [Pseudomonas brassicae]NER65970.1 Flp family type IVb pilin [Pseudomonas brassicae]